MEHFSKRRLFLFLIPTVMLFYAPFHEGDYDFYMILRFVVAFGAWFQGLRTVADFDKWIFGIPFFIAMVLFFPFADGMIELPREVWKFIDIGLGIYWIIAYLPNMKKEWD